jgi:O-antigen/teichoic acid export membrane protein
MKIAESHLARTAIASTWIYSTRLLGLGFTALLIAKLGIADYGKYALGVAAAATINAAIDNAFYVRSLRIDDDRFERERCARVIFGTAIGIIGVVCFLDWYVVGFAIVVAAGELLFNAFKSQYLRAGRPDVATRFDAIRQPASIAPAAAYLFLASEPHLSIATALYVAPYAVIMVVCFKYVPGRRPARPGGRREIFILSTEALAAAIYGQGDLLMLGLFAGDKVTGYYSVALVTAIAVSTIGQQYASTFVVHMRAAAGQLHSAPLLRDLLKVAMVTGAAMAAIGGGILIWGGADNVGIICLIMSLWVAARSVEFSFVAILFQQHRDALRVRATSAAAVLKLSLLFPVVHFFGAYGAATASVLCEFVLIAVYYRGIYHQRIKPDRDTAGEVRQQ